jgi:putative molybdopterin biosynthesis protein
MDGVAVPVAAATSDSHGDIVWAAGSWFVVDTGDVLPGPADAVVRREHVRMVAGAVHTQRSVALGSDVRARGDDMSCGEVILPARHRIRPVDLAAAAGGGVDELDVLLQPVVAVLPTGDEIRPVRHHLGAGEIRDTNSLMLAGLLEQLGAQPLLLPVVPDDPDLLRIAIEDAGRRAQLILVIAGTSAGRDDHTADVLTSLGTLAFRGVAMRPGHPVIAGVLTGTLDAAEPTPVIGLPGYPVAAADAFDLLARPILEMVSPPAAAGSVQARLGAPLASTVGLRDARRVRLTAIGPTDAEAQPVAIPLPRGAAAATTLVAAEGIVRIPAALNGYAIGDTVAVELVSGAIEPGRTISIWGPATSIAADRFERAIRRTHPRGVIHWTDARAPEAIGALTDGLCHAAVIVVERGTRAPTTPPDFHSTALVTDQSATELLLARPNTAITEFFAESVVAQCVTQ